MGQIHVDDMTLEILRTDLRNVRVKSVEAVLKICFTRSSLMVALE